MSTSEAIRARREKANITQAELARRVGVTRFTVCKWESGARSPDKQFWAPLAREIGVTVQELHPAMAACMGDAR